MSEYNRDDIKMVISGTLGITHIVEGYADGEFLSIEPDGDGFTETVGSHKTVTRNRIDMPGAMVKLKLHPGSPSISVLHKLWLADRGTGNNKFRLLIKDVRSIGNMMVSTTAYIKNTPVLKFANDAQPKDFEIRCLVAEIGHGEQLDA